MATSSNVYLNSGGLTFRHRYPFVEPQKKLRRALEMLRAEKIAWGSDYPRPGLVADASYKQQLEFITIECDFLTEKERERIVGGTVLDVYQWET